MEVHRYRITVEHLAAPPEAARKPTPLNFEVTSPDDLFALVEKLGRHHKFPHGTARAFGLGLKLLGEVMRKNAHNPLFATILPQFRKFLQELKGRPA